jgi:putative glycosyltransferase (TIGR04372 family)
MIKKMLSDRLSKIISQAMSSLHGNKTPAELATDYEIHPQSMLYRLCDWIGKRTGTIILTPHMLVVGNCGEDVYFGLLKARREGKKLVILWPYELPGRLKFRLTNVEVINVASDYRAVSHDSFVNIAARILLTAYFAFFRTLSYMHRLFLGIHLSNVYRIPIIGESTLWQPEWVRDFSWDVVHQYDWPRQLATPLPVSLTKKKQLIAEHQRALLGLPKDAWFVCLHVRESGFHKDTVSERNANIFNYIGAIEEITSRGGWVVRMGDSTMTRLPVMERVIDYPFTESKSALMDVYLISQCRLYIGMMSGIYDVAVLFQRPMIMTNMSNWMWTFPLKKSDLGVMKHVYSKSKNGFLSVREVLAEPWTVVSFLGMGDEYVLYENDSDELRAVVKEFFERGDYWEPTALQRQFNELRILTGRKIISEEMFNAGNVQPYYSKNVAEYDLLERYRLASRLDSAVGMLGANYLQQNWEVDVRNGKITKLYGCEVAQADV